MEISFTMKPMTPTTPKPRTTSLRYRKNSSLSLFLESLITEAIDWIKSRTVKIGTRPRRLEVFIWLVDALPRTLSLIRDELSFLHSNCRRLSDNR